MITKQEKAALLTELNNTFNETTKYMQFRFQELANRISAIPEEPVKESDKELKKEE